MVSQALMPKRCKVLLETVKELPPFGPTETKGHGLCHDRRPVVPLVMPACDLCANAGRQPRQVT
jgi:hypothetical protein